MFLTTRSLGAILTVSILVACDPKPTAVEVEPAAQAKALAPAKIVFAQEQLALKTGESKKPEFQIVDEANAPVAGEVVWQSSDEKIARVSADGAIVASSPGAATMTARAGQLSASLAVTVTPGELTALEPENPESTIKKGETRIFSCIGVDKAGNRFPIALLWDTADRKVI